MNGNVPQPVLFDAALVAKAEIHLFGGMSAVRGRDCSGPVGLGGCCGLSWDWSDVAGIELAAVAVEFRGGAVLGLCEVGRSAPGSSKIECGAELRSLCQQIVAE